MKIIFQGKSDEYEIEKSYFCNRAFIVKDKIPNRDKIDFVSDNITLLEFSDHSFEFDEILKCLHDENEENTIIVEEIFVKNTTNRIEQDKELSHSLLEIKVDETPKNNIKFTPFNAFSRIFNKDCFVFVSNNCKQKESISVEKNQKLNIFETLKIEDLDTSFAKIEIVDYDADNDSMNFDLDAFPSGASYKYGISQNTMYIILQGKMTSCLLLDFLKSFVYKNKKELACEKTFVLMLNHKLAYELKVFFV
ncbi:hypothetical protein MUL68_000412 [Campylobacter coli]|nr:hypothetical protein [Campylobacter coli]